jgi:hypothetical protein
MAQPGKRHRGGGARTRAATAEKWARWQVLATAARFVVELLRLLRDHVISGSGPGRLP